MNKSRATNLVALLITISGYYSPIYGNLIFMTGIFALSGSITNWLAIHMLFEKIPFLYGSGVIPNRFEDFKAAIKTLIIEQFFTREHIEKFFQENGNSTAESITNKIDFDHVFAGLVEAITNSSLGGMLAMVGGAKALEPLREPVSAKLKEIVSELATKELSEGGEDHFADGLIEKISNIIDTRLEELTPENVKRIVQDMIQQHLGWLVVWGGVFGGLIGLIVSLISQ